MNILTIDVEDWYESSLEVLRKKGYPSGASAPSRRVVFNTMRLLDTLEEFRSKGTRFILGTVAEAYPSLVRRISRAGFEVDTHGYGHKLVYTIGREEFRADLILTCHQDSTII